MTATQCSSDGSNYYQQNFSRAEMADLDRALGESLKGEIGMLRIVMRRFFERAAQEADDLAALSDVLRVLGLSVSRLAKVLQTEQSLQAKGSGELGDALSRCIETVLEELGQANGHDREAASDG